MVYITRQGTSIWGCWGPERAPASPPRAARRPEPGASASVTREGIAVHDAALEKRTAERWAPSVLRAKVFWPRGGVCRVPEPASGSGPDWSFAHELLLPVNDYKVQLPGGRIIWPHYSLDGLTRLSGRTLGVRKLSDVPSVPRNALPLLPESSSVCTQGCEKDDVVPWRPPARRLRRLSPSEAAGPTGWGPPA